MSTAREQHHKTLSAYYPRLHSLHEYLSTAPSASASTERGLIRPNDNEDYLRLIQDTLCGLGETASVPQMPGKDEVYGTQQEIIDRVLSELGRRAAGGKRNVLLSNDIFVSSNLPVNFARPGVDNRDTSSPSALLRSRPWQILRSRIGDSAFRHILLYTSLYLPIGNNCYMQLSGEPIYERYQHQHHLAVPTVSEVPPSPTGKTRRHAKKRKRKAGCGGEDFSNRDPPKRHKAADINIARQRMFYGQPARRPNGALIHGFPPTHLLNKLCVSGQAEPSYAKCLRLLQDIFPNFLATPTAGSGPPGHSLNIKGSPKRVSPMLGIAKEMIIRHGILPYGRKVKRCIERLQAGQTSDELGSASHSQVCRFLTGVLSEVLSPAIVGSKHNLQVIVRHARRLVQAKQYELISLHSLMQDIHMTDFTWLASPHSETGRSTAQESVKVRSLVEELLLWLFNSYLIPLLKNTFYITETSTTRYETVFFAHEQWQAAAAPHLRQLEVNLLTELSDHERYLALQGPLGVSAVRLIPKPNGFRPIVNLGRRIKPKALLGISTTGSGRGQSANEVLRNVHQVLTFEKDRKRSSLGSALFGTNEIFAPLRTLKQDLLKTHGRLPKLYLAKMDIKAAFDTIKQDKMIEIITSFLDQNHDYWLMMYCLLLPPASKASQGSARRLFKTRAILNDGSSTGFSDHAQDIAAPRRNAVLIDLARRRQVTRDACLQLLVQHIKHNVWQIGSKYFRQKTGIPQGSKVSSLLCSIFYASLEKQHLSFASRPGSRLLRYIDDFLFISDDYHTARQFVRTMHAGFPEYGAFVSPNKTLLSFEFATRSQVAPVCDTTQGNYARYEYGPPEDVDWAQSFALRSNKKRGTAFVGWLSRQLENRNHVAYLDTNHNHMNTVHMNVFLNFALTCMKIPHYFSTTETISAHRSKSIFDALCMAIEYTYVAGRARVKHASRDDPIRDHYAVRKGDFTFLAKTAIFRVLSRKASRFKALIRLLGDDLHSRPYRGKAAVLGEVIEKGWNAVKGAKY